MQQLAVFEIFTVKWQKLVSEKPKMVQQKSFCDPAFGDPYISLPKGRSYV